MHYLASEEKGIDIGNEHDDSEGEPLDNEKFNDETEIVKPQESSCSLS